MRHVLLVHDQIEGSSARRHFLECAGFRVSTAATSLECASVLANDTPDLLLVDALVEGQNGFELCAEVRRKFSASELPLVLASGIYTADVFRRAAAQVGAQAYLVDPRDYEALLAAVHHALVARDADTAQVAA